MKLLEGKVAVVTGAARGIGKAIALQFAKEGANVAFTDLAIDENGKATEAEIAALGVKCKGYASNAADFEQTHEVVKRIVEEFGRIDILVNNAGIKEMGPRGIRANCIAPGFIITDMTDKLPDEVKEGWYKQIPLRRGGTPEDVAKVALFLASDLSSYVSGQVIHCCGAMNC